MCVRVPGKRAQDAWYTTSILIEETITKQLKVAGASADVMKCVGQINTNVIRKICQKAGMPKRILEPYLRYIENLRIRYRLAVP